MHCSPPGSSIHGILQARTLEWVAISFSRRSSWPRDLNIGLPHHRQTLYRLSHQESVFYFSNTLSPLWATSSSYNVSRCLLRLLFFSFLWPFGPQPTLYGSQFCWSRFRSSSTASTLRPLLPPSFSSAGHGHSSWTPSPACSRGKLWDLTPPSTPRVPRFYPNLPRSPPHTWSRTTLKQETSLQDLAPSPAHSSLYGKQLEQKPFLGFMSHSPSLICLKSKSILASSLQTIKVSKRIWISYPVLWLNLAWYSHPILHSSPREKEWVWQASWAHTDEDTQDRQD